MTKQNISTDKPLNAAPDSKGSLMPLTKENFENFYLGSGAEHKITSEIFLHGFEAHKFNPDIGIDLLVTNKASCQFHETEEISHHLQIKSTFLINGEARFFIKDDELNFLKADKRTTVVFCYFSPIIAAEPKSFDRGDFEPWWEKEEASFMRHLYETEFRNIKKEGCLSKLDFKGFKMNYIWLNNAQLNRAIDEGFIFNSHENLHKLTLTEKHDEPVTILSNEQNGYPISEIKNIYYLLKGSKSSDRLHHGDFLLDHY